jgi:iron complex outermembrane recepter protein
MRTPKAPIIKLKSGRAILVLATACIAVPAFAQEAEAADDGGIGEIVVTAQKRLQNVQSVSVAISVATEGDIDRLQVTNLASLQYSTPSLVVAGSDPTRQRFGIRGVSDQSRNAGVDNRIGVYVDGVWVGRSAASNQDAMDVQSIEIMRGPQGTLFGKNTVAGAINITSKKPQPGQLRGELEGEAGNYGLLRIKGAINLGFSDEAALRVSGGYKYRDGFTRNAFNKLDYDGRDDYDFRGQALYDGGNTKIYVAGDTAKQNTRALAGGERAPDTVTPTPREISIDMLQDLTIEYKGVSGHIDHVLDNGGTLTSISAYRTSDYGGSGDEDYSSANLARTIAFGESTKHFSQEIRYASDTSNALDYVVGLYFLHQNLMSNGAAEAFAPALDPLAPAIFVGVSQNAVVRSQSYAVFFHANYRFDEAVELTFGARLNHEKKDIIFNISDTTGLFTNGALTDKRSTTDLSPTASLNYNLNEDVLTYARYSHGVKSGGWNADFIRSINDIKFGEESADTYELGLKAMLFDRKLRLNAAAYLSKHKNYQVFAFVQLSNGGTALNVTNVGKLRSRGFEIETELPLTNWLTLDASYGYNDSTFDSFKNGGGADVNFDGNRAADAPKHNLNLGVSTVFNIGFSRLHLQGDYSYRSSFFSNPDNLPINLNSSFENINLRAGLDFGMVSIFAWMRNTANDTTQIYNARSFLGFPFAKYNDPQTYGVTLKVLFGDLR